MLDDYTLANKTNVTISLDYDVRNKSFAIIRRELKMSFSAWINEQLKKLVEEHENA